MFKALLLNFLALYQKFFTLIGYGSCRYYPTCSEYAKWQVQNNHPLKAIGLSLLRILKCNQLFEGGIDYPIIHKHIHSCPLLPYNETKNSFIVEFWLVPKNKHTYYVIKSFSKD